MSSCSRIDFTDCFAMRQGRSFVFSYAQTLNGTPQNLTGATLLWTTSYPFTITYAWVDITLGTATFTVSAATTSTYAVGRYQHNMKITWASGQVDDIMEGYLEILPWPTT